MMKKIFTTIVLLFGVLVLQNQVKANENEIIQNVNVSVLRLDEKQYKHKTVLKHYIPYSLSLNNMSDKPIMLTSSSELEMILWDGTVIKSPTRRELYRHSRKRDMGRYYGLAIPGAIIAGGITGITFFIGAPVAAAVYIGMYLPCDKAVRSNVKISQDLYTSNKMPIRLENGKDYDIRLLLPKKLDVKKVFITNVTYDMKKMYDIKIPVEVL